MNRLSGAGSRTVFASIALVVAGLTLAGCAGDGKPTPKASPGATSSSSSGGMSSGTLSDQSAAVLGWTPPSPIAKTEGKLAPQVSLDRTATVPATAEVISVQASDASTVLTWQLSSATDMPVQGLTLNLVNSARFWPDAVRLVDLVGKKSYAVNTMAVDIKTYCVCSRYPLHVGPDPVRMTSEYPPLPASVTSISVRIPNFAPVTVPVTR